MINRIKQLWASKVAPKATEKHRIQKLEDRAAMLEVILDDYLSDTKQSSARALLRLNSLYRITNNDKPKQLTKVPRGTRS